MFNPTFYLNPRAMKKQAAIYHLSVFCGCWCDNSLELVWQSSNPISLYHLPHTRRELNLAQNEGDRQGIV